MCEDNFDNLISSGYCRATTTISLDDQEEILKSLSLHYTFLVRKAEIDQYVDGLNSLGLLKLIREKNVLFRKFFCIPPKSVYVTAGIVFLCYKIASLNWYITEYIRSMLSDIKFSEEGSSSREKEQATYMLFLRYLQTCERSETLFKSLSI